MNPFPPKEPSPDFSNPTTQKTYIQNTETSKELMQKELDVNRAEQVLLRQRMELMTSFLNDLSSSDPEYSTLLTQLHMDRIELDELRAREVLLIHHLSPQ